MSLIGTQRHRLGIRPVRLLRIAAITVCFLVPDSSSQAPVESPPVTLLHKRLGVLHIRTPSWHGAVRTLASENKLPYLLELDTLSYLDMTTRYKMGLFDKAHSEKESIQRLTKYKLDFGGGTLEGALKAILQSDSRYVYELTEEGRCLHVFPAGILKRTDWPLNRVASGFQISHESSNYQWYRKTLGRFLIPHKVHIGIFREDGMGPRLKPTVYPDITLRQLLMKLAVMGEVGWTIEPLPEEETAVRDTLAMRGICDYRGYDIGKPSGSGWCQLHCHPLFPPPGTQGH